ncbi:hypothetical protein SAMN04489844_3601 [Nocardioides exalbidus]|uniref:DUF4386 family protein n=1 Tax=Nocardioides exalbidus TaxID=402596 RepID=A0A1H4XM13_9ACTN|nr:hypothetical protein [Nocardioides exalbidus]SED06732.1 hypothetical protein SAMN04489844_3601 [Nocardioides exalbidus]
MTMIDAPPAPVRSPGPDLVPAARVAFALLVLSQVAVVAFTMWEPPFDGVIRYDDIAPLGSAYWPMNVLVGGPAYALGTVTATVFLAVLGAGRATGASMVASMVGCVLHLLGGLVFALVITAEVLPFAWAADPAVVGEQEGRALFAAYNDHFDAFLPYVLGSMAAVALGVLLAVVGAALSGGLRWWVPALVLALVVAQFAVPFHHPLVPALSLVQRVVWIGLGWAGLRRVARRG